MNSIVNLPLGLNDKEKANFKKQYWYILIYEDSVVDGYIDILKTFNYKMAVSPWHDKDIDENGDLKKKHRHLLVDFGGSVRLKQVLDICNAINSPSDVMWRGNKKLAYEYLFHKNDPDKYQYNYSDIIHINSKSYDWISTGYKDILNYIDEYKITSLIKLTRWLRDDENDDLLEYVSKNTYYVNSYLNDYKNVTMSEVKELNIHLNSLQDLLLRLYDELSDRLEDYEIITNEKLFDEILTVSRACQLILGTKQW